MAGKGVGGGKEWGDLERLLDEALERQGEGEAGEVSEEPGSGDRMMAWILVVVFWIVVFVVAYLL